MSWLTKKEFARELGTNVNNLNQILFSGPKDKKFPKPVKGKHYKNQDGVNVYSPEFIKLVKSTRTTAKSKSTKTTKAVKTARMTNNHGKILVAFDLSQLPTLLEKFPKETNAALQKALS